MAAPHNKSCEELDGNFACYKEDGQAYKIRPTEETISDFEVKTKNITDTLSLINALRSSSVKLFTAGEFVFESKHDHQKLLKLKASILPLGYELLGENLAQTDNTKESIKLMFLSPRHKKMLLNPKATHVYINDKKKGEVRLLFFRRI